MFKHFARHPRIWISALAAVLTFLLLPSQWILAARVLVAWDLGVLLFLVLCYCFMASLSATQLCERYMEEDESAPVILVVSVLGALLAMVAIVMLLSSMDAATRTVKLQHVGFAALTVVETWLLIPTMFTLHYAGLYYSAGPDERPVHFPETPMPAFWDFAYFSFTIASACQTADVTTLQAPIRRLVAVQSVLAFFFNAAILGFAINVTAGLIGSH